MEKRLSDMDEIVGEFIVESNEGLDQMDRDLIELESNPTSQETLARIFRTVHSIKGATGFMGFTKLGDVAHAGENLLSRLRDGRLSLKPDITTCLLNLTGVIRTMLSEIATRGCESDANYSVVIEALTRYQGCQQNSSPGTLPDSEKSASSNVAPPEKRIGTGNSRDQIASQQVLEPKFGTQENQASDDAFPSNRPTIDKATGSEATASELRSTAAHFQSVEAATLRVDVHQLDKLMDLVGELVLARNQILQLKTIQQDPALFGSAHQLDVITSELQEMVARTRMQPIDRIWNKLPRLTRDLTRECQKKVRLEMYGKETELDKTILENLRDPLTHLVRNAIDHGIESPDLRLAAGKSPEGCLSLRAFHENGQMNIEISDDGEGIDLDRVKQKAVERNLVTPEKARFLDDREALKLIFSPGFSTADAVTRVSGRGVGMDVVKTNIKKVGGTVEIESHRGFGTKVRIRIPLTLAILPSLIFQAGGNVYAIPQQNVVELIHLDEMTGKGHIDAIQGKKLCRLRGRLLPLIFLDELLGVAPEDRSNLRGTAVVLEVHDRQFGLVVSQVTDIVEIVAKPLGKHLKGLPIYAGATILGDGRVALILDVLGLAHQGSIIPKGETKTSATPVLDSRLTAHPADQWLIFEVPGEEQVAMSLANVTRLEEFPYSRLEFSEGQQVMQYMDEIMPLISIPDTFADKSLGAIPTGWQRPIGEKVHVVVCSRQGRPFGLVVERILDIVERTPPQTSEPGHVGNKMVVAGRVTRILSVDELNSLLPFPKTDAVELEA